MKRAIWLAAGHLFLASACADRDEAARDTTVAERAATVSDSGGPRADSALVRSAREVVGFLAGELPFDSLRLADTVELRIAPEGGGATKRIGRTALRDRASWAVAGPPGRVSLIPPAGYSLLSARAGRHFNCQEQDLASRAPDLAARPHVGVRMQPDGASSCLQSWNASFVFDTAGGAPSLVAVLYDQWEW